MNNLPKTDPWSHLYAAKYRVIACETVIEAMLPGLQAEVPYEVLEFGLHIQPTPINNQRTGFG